MGVAEWVLAGVVILAVAFVILRPDLWGRRDNGNPDGGQTPVGVHPRDDDDGEGGD